MLSLDITATAFARDRPVAAARAIALARIEVLADCAAAEHIWQRLADSDALATPYGKFDWLSAWYGDVAANQGEAPLIAVGYDAADAPLFLLPLTVSRGAGLTIARFAGGAHAQLNLGLWRRDVLTAWRADVMQAALAGIAARRNIDLFVLRNLPMTWQGFASPLTALPHQRAPANAHSVSWTAKTGDDAIQATVSSGNRKRMRAKERKLQALDGYRFFRAASEAEVDRLLAIFLEQKGRYFAAACIANPFDEPGVAAFLRTCCRRGLEAGHPAIELHAIEAQGEVLAIIGGASDRHRFSAMFNSITSDEQMARLSPGLVLMYLLIHHSADRGLASYDHGIGFAPYKQQFCKDVDALADSFLGFSARGKAAALAYRLAYAAKRIIKTTPATWSMVCAFRRMRAQLRRPA